MAVRVAATRDGDRAELRRGRAEVVHVAARDRREVDRLGEPPEGQLEVRLRALLRVELARAPAHLAAPARPVDREDVHDHARTPGADRVRGMRGRGPRPRHRAAFVRHPEVALRPEVRAEGVLVELRSDATPVHEAVDVGGVEAAVGERALDGLRADRDRVAARRTAVIRFADARDRDGAAHVVDLGRGAPGHALGQSPKRRCAFVPRIFAFVAAPRSSRLRSAFALSGNSLSQCG
jgi:hypothetical protein